MPTLRAFLKGQECIYDEFRRLAAEEVVTKGVKTDPRLTERFGGFSVNISPSAEVARRAADFSKKISAAVSAIIYPAEEIHTTLCGYGAGPGFLADIKKPEFRDVLRGLISGVEEILPAVRRFSCAINNYDGYLYTPAVVIAAGRPNEAFIELMASVEESCYKKGLILRPAWGAHITLSRFLNVEIPPEGLGGFLKIVSETPPLGRSVATRLNVGYTSWKSCDIDVSQENCGRFVSCASFLL